MRILVVDDDPVYRVQMDALMSQWDNQVVVANDGQQAWKMLQEAPLPDLVLLDWMMPNMDGFELCRQIRANPQMEGLYLILFTGTRQKEDIIKVLVAGADDYLLKPFEPLDLKIRLRTAKRILDLQEELARLRNTPREIPIG